MKAIRRARLEPVEFGKDHWEEKVVDLSFVADDRPGHYHGCALTCPEGPGHVIEFEFRTTALRPAEVRIPLLLSSDASVKMSVSGVYVKDFEFTARRKPAPRLHYIGEDITRWTEARETSRLKLLISYKRQTGSTTIPFGDGETEPRPEVLQRRVWPHALQAFLFFALSWSCVIGLAVLLLAHFQPLGDKLRFYAVLTAVFTWMAGACGLPDVAKIPVRPMLRRLYSGTRADPSARLLSGGRRRFALLAALSLSFILISSGVGVVIYCLSVRQYYTSLINSALRTNDPDSKLEYISRALALLPWRKEAQMLFEREAWTKRSTEQMSGFRRYIKEFATRQDVKRAIAGAPDADHLPLSLTTSAGSSFLHDPVIWYASTIIEGEEQHETALMGEATSLLANRRGPEAQIQLWNLRLGQMLADEGAAEDEVDEAARVLGGLLEKNYKLRGVYVYQAACDTLAGYHLRRCDPEADAQGSLKEAARWYKAELDARKHQLADDGEPLWLRPPDKLMLFYMFGTGWKMSGQAADNARCLLKTQDCEEPVEELEPCDFGPTFTRELWEPNLDYQKEAAWTRGTLRDESLKTTIAPVIERSLNKGWRY